MKAHTSDRERVILASVLQHPGEPMPPNLARVIGYGADAFTLAETRTIADAVRRARTNGTIPDGAAISGCLTGDGISALATLLSAASLPLELADLEAEPLLEAVTALKVWEVATEAAERAKANPAEAPAVAAALADALRDLTHSASHGDQVQAVLSARRFNPAIEPPPLRPIYSLTGTPICTPGNLTTITAAVKSGKSAAIGAMMASAMPRGPEADLLGFESANPDGLALLLFDSEQSPDDFWHCVNRAVKRAGLATPPAWLHAYCLTGLGSKRSWEAVIEAIKTACDDAKGIHSILLDGAADFVADVNDAAESNDFVAELHNLAIEHACPIIGVIHFNPGSDKSRGHLGSQLERKAETNLALEKDSDETTVIYSTKNRRAGIPKAKGPRFKFDPEAGMHVTVESRESARTEAKREELLCFAQDIFGEYLSMRYTEIQTTVKKQADCSLKTAQRKVDEMRRLAVIKQSAAGLYVIATPTTT